MIAFDLGTSVGGVNIAAALNKKGINIKFYIIMVLSEFISDSIIMTH